MKEPIDGELVNEQDNTYEFYRNFMNVEEAENFAQLLDKHDISYRMESTGTVIDSAIVGRGLVPKAILKVLRGDFKKVNQLLAQQVQDVTYEEIGDHYLTQLDTEELKDIFNKQDEWSAEDVAIARIILNKRGVSISPDESERLRKERFEEIRKGKEASNSWVILYSLGIIFGLFTSWIFVVAGVGMGYYYAYGKSTDPDGNRYFVFRERTRLIGTVMLYGGITLLLIQIFFFGGFLFGPVIEPY
ncbi:MAG: hypothetical protein AAFV95_19280 [Bacteroidota bacterium]